MLLVIVGWILWRSGESKSPESARKKMIASSATPQHAFGLPQTNALRRQNASAPPAKVTAPWLASQGSGFPRRAHDVFEGQLALARLAISSGSLDGVKGPQTRAALLAF